LGDLYPEFTETDDDDYAYSEFARRAAPYCLRIAGLHAALDGRALISKDHLAAAGAGPVLRRIGPVCPRPPSIATRGSKGWNAPSPQRGRPD